MVWITCGLRKCQTKMGSGESCEARSIRSTRRDLDTVHAVQRANEVAMRVAYDMLAESDSPRAATLGHREHINVTKHGKAISLKALIICVYVSKKEGISS